MSDTDAIPVCFPQPGRSHLCYNNAITAPGGDAPMATIFHVDVNSAFLSWSALKKLEEDPGSIDLRTVPSAVGGDVKTRHGIITAKSIPAKKYGVETGEPVVKALAKCPALILVKSDFATYRMYSSRLMEILRTYTPYVEQASIDEAYMDVSGLCNAGSPESSEARFSQTGSPPDTDSTGSRAAALVLARNIADRVRNELGFTVNVGISTNKFLAKMASDFSKPDKVHTLYPEEIQHKLWPLPIGDLHGCGQATTAKLRNIGINTIGEAASADLAELQRVLGLKSGFYIHERANGRDDSKVDFKEREAKSYSNETTTAEDVTGENYQKLALPILKELCSKVASRLQKDNVSGHTVFVMVKTGDFRRYSRQTTLPSPTDNEDEIFKQAQELLQRLLFGSGRSAVNGMSTGIPGFDGLFAGGAALRLIGVGVSNLDDNVNRQMTLDEWAQLSKVHVKERERNRKLDQMLEQIRKRYGTDAIGKGTVKKSGK